MTCHRPKVEIDRDSGFCNGVVTAIRKAEEELNLNGRLYCLGDIVHNSDEVDRLRSKGLITITHEELAKLHNVKVLFRAHGEPPSTYDMARRNNIEIIDATCPVVLMLQRRIKASFDSGSPRPQIVIYGKTGHAEVNGLVGQTMGQAIVVEHPEDLDKLDFTRDTELYSQTTKSIEGLRTLSSIISSRKSRSAKFTTHDTICRQVSNRVPKLISFAKSHDVVLFVSGAKSSNGRILFDECRRVNPHSHHISNVSQLHPDLLTDAASIGICGATSTPRWLMEEVKTEVERLLDMRKDG